MERSLVHQPGARGKPSLIQHDEGLWQVPSSSASSIIAARQRPKHKAPWTITPRGYPQTHRPNNRQPISMQHEQKLKHGLRSELLPKGSADDRCAGIRNGPHLRVPAERIRIPGDRRPYRWPRRYRHRQHLRSDRRGRTAGTTGGAPGTAAAAGCKDRRDRLRGADRPRRLGGDAGGRPRRRQYREIGPRRLPAGERCAGAGQRHHGRARNGEPSGWRLRRKGPGLCPGPERLRPPLHLLHHSLRPGQQSIGRARPDRRAGAHPRRQRLSRDRADRRRHHRLRRRPAGRADAGPDGEAAARGRAGAGAPAPDLAGLRRGRRHACSA